MSQKYVGVTQVGDKFRVQIFRKGKNFYLGQFDDPKVAASIADSSNVLTIAWAGRKPALNFNDVKRPEETQLTPEQREMLAHLRMYHPEDERRFVKEEAAGGYVPSVVIEHFEATLDRLDGIYPLMRDTLAAGRSSLISLSNQLHEKDKMIEWLRATNTELEEKLRGRDFVEELKKRNGGVLMQRVVPGEVAPSPVLERPAMDVGFVPGAGAPLSVKVDLGQSQVPGVPIAEAPESVKDDAVSAPETPASV